MSSAIQSSLKPRLKESVWQWAEREVTFSKHYPTAKPGRYSSAWVPFWREPMEALTDKSVKEVVVLKCAQAGGSENMILVPIRYHVAVAPMPVMYVSGQQELTEAFLEERIKVALNDSACTRSQLQRARVRGSEIYFPHMPFAVTWSTSTQGLKSRPVGAVFCDELSTWPANSLDKLRLRMATYPFAHMAVISAPDAQANRSSDEDPIFIEYAQTDQREYYLPDPGAPGDFFRFHMGGETTVDGLKWDREARNSDGKWDMDRVRRSARYVTPSGAIITDRQKAELVSSGQWRPTITANVRSDRRGYHVSAFMLPWVSWGDIACAFIDAKAKGPANLKVFVYEWLAERWYEEKESLPDQVIFDRQSERPAGVDHDKTTECVVISVDVQKDHFWWVCRAFLDRDNSRLMGYGRCDTWDQLSEIGKKYDAQRGLVDSGYGERTPEVYRECAKRFFNPTKGFDRESVMPWTMTMINPFEGTRRAQGSRRSLSLYQFHTDTFKLRLLDRIYAPKPGQSWTVYKGIEAEYVSQMIAEERVDGSWRLRRGMKNNHLWDCEVLQELASEVYLGR